MPEKRGSDRPYEQQIFSHLSGRYLREEWACEDNKRRSVAGCCIDRIVQESCSLAIVVCMPREVLVLCRHRRPRHEAQKEREKNRICRHKVAVDGYIVRSTMAAFPEGVRPSIPAIPMALDGRFIRLEHWSPCRFGGDHSAHSSTLAAWPCPYYVVDVCPKAVGFQGLSQDYCVRQDSAVRDPAPLRRRSLQPAAPPNCPLMTSTSPSPSLRAQAVLGLLAVPFVPLKNSLLLLHPKTKL